VILWLGATLPEKLRSKYHYLLLKEVKMRHLLSLSLNPKLKKRNQKAVKKKVRNRGQKKKPNNNR